MNRTLWIDLLDDFELDKYQSQPQILRQELEGFGKSQRPAWVVVDEVQNTKDLTSIIEISRDIPSSEAYVFSNDKTAKKVGHVWILPWMEGIKEIGLYGQ
jgi:hypothetical protein